MNNHSKTVQPQFYSSSAPLYVQIAQQLKMDIAAGKLPQGQRLPTVRERAQQCNINPGTVARAYAELERDGILHTRRGSGTFVAIRTEDKWLELLREERLSAVFNRSILEGLGLGYSPEELEALFVLYLANWREERARRESDGIANHISADAESVVFAGSHDMAVELLASHIRRKHPKPRFEATYVGSLDGLIALEQNRAHLCGMHLLDEETGEYNLPYVKRIMPGERVVLINLSYRRQGLIVERGNPNGIGSIEDLLRSDVTLINRQRGSGTRVLLDHELRQAGIENNVIRGHDNEVKTHTAVAAAVAGGVADVGLGIEAAAQALNLDFLPLVEERYDLVIPERLYGSELLAPLISVIRSEEFRMALSALKGYRSDHTGEVMTIV